MRTQTVEEICNEAFDLAMKNSTETDWFTQLSIATPEKLKEIKLRNIYNIKEDPALSKKFEKLKSIIKKRILQQIEKLDKRGRCVLFIGNDGVIIKGIVSYICYIHTYNRLVYEDCLGWDEDRIKRELLEEERPFYKYTYSGGTEIYGHSGNKYKIKEYLSGNTLFLRDFEERNSLKQLAGIVRSRATGEHGMLVISMTNAENLPEEFVKQSNIIYLKTIIQFDDKTKTITINDQKFLNVPDREYMLFEFLYKNKDSYLSKDDILDKLEMGGEDQIFKLVTNLRNLFKEYPLTFYNLKETKNREGGYRLIIED